MYTKRSTKCACITCIAVTVISKLS